jgi:hypothetical protein
VHVQQFGRTDAAMAGVGEMIVTISGVAEAVAAPA